MPPLPVITDVFRCAIEWQVAGGGQNAVNVLHVLSNTATPADVAAAIDDVPDSDMLNSVSGVWVANTVAITPLDGTTATSVHPLTNWTPPSATDGEPAVSTLVSLRTAFRGPANRGRIYLPAVREGAAANGFLDGTVGGLMQTAWESYVAQLETHDVTLGVASYKNAEFHSVVSLLVEHPLATQKRRQDRNR